MQEIIIQNIPVYFTRKNIKNINLRISKPDGIVRISAPYLSSMKMVEKFVEKNKDWILKTQQKVISNPKNKAGESLFGGNFKFDSGKAIYV